MFSNVPPVAAGASLYNWQRSIVRPLPSDSYVNVCLYSQTNNYCGVSARFCLRVRSCVLMNRRTTRLLKNRTRKVARLPIDCASSKIITILSVAPMILNKPTTRLRLVYCTLQVQSYTYVCIYSMSFIKNGKSFLESKIWTFHVFCPNKIRNIHKLYVIQMFGSNWVMFL